MEIRLKELTLENFKGMREFTLAPQARNCLIKGDNSTGKTTCMDAFLWLFFAKDSTGKADFALKTLDGTGQQIPNLNHRVEGVIDIDGREIVLTKEFKEKYTKKRGQPQAEFTGHTTDYYIDGVPVQLKDWSNQISEIIDENTLKLLTNPRYFNSLHWQKRRDILLQVCGDIADADVIASDDRLSELPEILGNKSLEEHRKVVTAKKKAINDRLRELPARIDELHKSLTDVSSYDESAIAVRMSRLDGQIRAIKDDTNLAALRKEKAELQATLSEAQADLAEERAQAGKAFNEKLGDIEDELRKGKSDLRAMATDLAHTVESIKRNKREIALRREEFQEISNKQFEGETVCPTCGQTLPKEQVLKARAHHNEQKAAQLAKINEEGKRLAAETEGLESKKRALEKAQGNLQEKFNPLGAQLAELVGQKAEAIAKAGQGILDKIEKLHAEILTVTEAIANYEIPDTSALESELNAERAKIAEIKTSKKTLERIEALRTTEKDMAKAYEDLESQTYLMEQFIVAKVELLEEKINNKFELARFKLFNVLVNGGIEETCVTLYDGVPYGLGLNSGAEINVGLDIIRTLSEFYRIKAPVWVDHKESVTGLLDPGSQIIKLAVDPNCPKLEVEYD